MNIFFISDTHFGHKNIIKYCDQDFKTIEEHDETIIKNWNNIVKRGDLVYFLGDFIFTKEPMDAVNIINRLNGNIIFIKGNHDYSNIFKVIKRVHPETMIYDLLDIKVKDEEIDGGVQRITLCHYPMISWNQSHRGAWQLFGHHHHGNEKGGAVYSKLTPNQLEVGVDGHDFTPISYERVKELITKQNLGR